MGASVTLSALKANVRRFSTGTASALLLYLLLSTRLAAAAGTTLYVSTTGTDSGDCTNESSPCLTIQYAIDQAASGDTIQVAAGTYSETVDITQAVTLEGAQAGVNGYNRSGAETIIQTPAGQDQTVLVQAPGVTINGFTIDGSTGTTQNAGITLAGSTATNLQVLDNIIENNKNGIYADSANVTGLQVSDNYFNDNNRDTTAGNNGVYATGANGAGVTITDNTFSNTTNGADDAAIQTSGTVAQPLTNVTVTGNSSTDDGSLLNTYAVATETVSGNTASDESGAAISIGTSTTGLTVSNNTLENSDAGVFFANSYPSGGAATTNVTVTGNTITGMTVGGVLIQANSIGSGIAVTNNTFASNTANIVNQSTTAITTDPGTTTTSSSSTTDTSGSATTPDTGFGEPAGSRLFTTLLILAVVSTGAGLAILYRQKIATRPTDNY